MSLRWAPGEDLSFRRHLTLFQIPISTTLSWLYSRYWVRSKAETPSIADVNLFQSDHFGEGVTDGLDTRLAYKTPTEIPGFVAIHAVSSSVRVWV